MGLNKFIVAIIISAGFNSYSQKNNQNIKVVYLEEPTIVVIQLDSLELEEVKKSMGEDNFFTATDDLMWYNSQLIEKMDSLKISMKYFEIDSLIIKTPKYKKLIKKDSISSLYNYYFYDGEVIEKRDLFELLSE
tara:strand:- start:59 stop:460 length:402 start_codon:yes stop_codon:yes gene_type:complete